jgi:hypothetical protein
VTLLAYSLEQKKFDPFVAPLLKVIERGRVVAARARRDCAEGFQPELIFAQHWVGRGAVPQGGVPEAKILFCGEFFYRPRGSDVGFDPSRCKVRPQARMSSRAARDDRGPSAGRKRAQDEG